MENKFSLRMTQLRKQNGLSQKLAAKNLGISQALLSHYEKGIRECGIDFIIKAAEVYSVSCDYLLGVTDRLPTSDGYSDVEGSSMELLGNPSLQNGRSELLKSLNILYSLVARMKVPTLHNDLNNVLYSYIYHIFRILQVSLSDKPNELFKLPLSKGVACYNYFEGTTCSSLMQHLENVKNEELVSKDYLAREYPNSIKSLISIIETVENQFKS